MSQFMLNATALSAAAFAPFGDVIETEGRAWRWINQGTSQRYDDLAQVDVLEGHGRALISIFRAHPQSLPLQVRALERHPLSSQAFYPLDCQPFLVIVAQQDERPIAERMRAFLSSGRQGVNYRRNTWHHSLIALGQIAHFLVIDRGGPEQNCEEMRIDDDVIRVTIPNQRS